MKYVYLILNPKENIDLANCPESLNYDYVNDGYCDGTHNIAECGYDGGDCCHAEGTQICYYCEGDDCICHYTATTHCKLITGRSYLIK